MNIIRFPIRAAHAATLTWRRALAGGASAREAAQAQCTARQMVTAGMSPAAVLALRGQKPPRGAA